MVYMPAFPHIYARKLVVFICDSSRNVLVKLPVANFGAQVNCAEFFAFSLYF